jgi:hypothetical protein
MAYFIFLKYLRSLEEFRKILMSKFLQNLLVQISKALVNSKIQIINSNFFFFVFGPANLTAHSAFGPARHAGPSPLVGRSHPCRPIWPMRRWRLRGSTFSLLVCVFRAGRFSLVSLSSGPGLSASSSSPADRPLPLLLIASGHPVPPSLQPSDARRGLHSMP